MRRVIARSVFVMFGAVIAAAIGTLTAVVLSRPGKDLLARLLSEESNRLVRGSVSIGRISGDFYSYLTFDSLVVRDTTGALLADLPRLEIRFQLPSLLAGRMVFDSVRAIAPRFEIVKHRGGRMNYQEVLRLGEGKGGGPSPLIRLDHLSIEGGHFTISVPWNPDGRLRSLAQKDSALAAERAKPGRRIEAAALPADGLMMVRELDQVTARIPSMLLSSPDRTPFTVEVDSLVARVSDPALSVRALEGTIVQGADSLVFDLKRAALPNTVVSGAGRIDWPRDTMLYRFEMAASAVDLADLRWISADFPAFTGVGRVRANSVAGSRTEYHLRGLRLGDRTNRVEGELVAILDSYRGLGFRNLDLGLDNLDLEVVRPYLDTLPLQGRLTGPLKASGFFDRMTVDADWVFRDARVEGQPDSRVAIQGDLTLGGPEGMVFHQTRVPRSDWDLRTIRLVTPAVALEGRLALAGTLEGPWRNVFYVGRVEHQDGSRPKSVLTGQARLDTRGAVLALDADLTVDTLDFDGIRTSFPSLPLQGAVRGKMALEGDLRRLHLDGELRGALGRYEIEGFTTLQPPRWAAESLSIAFEDANLSLLGNRGPVTRLTGNLLLSGELDSLVAPVGEIDLKVGRGIVRELAIDSGRVRLRIRDSVIAVDTAMARWEGGGLFGQGTLGWAEPHRGSLSADVVALSLAPFDSLAAALLQLSRGEVAEEDLMSGRARARLDVEGSLDRWRLSVESRADSVVWLDNRLRIAALSGQLSGGRLDSLGFAFQASVDSLQRGKLRFAGLGGRFEGRPERFDWQVEGSGAATAKVVAGGTWTGPIGTTSADRTLGVDSLALTVLDRTWRLTGPTTIRLDSITATAPIIASTPDGSSVIRIVGEGPESRQVTVSAVGLSLRDLYALIQRDTAGVSGAVALDARVGGTPAAPRVRGSASLTGAVIGAVQAPVVRSVFNYENRRLQSNLTFWRTGRPVLDLDADLPVDLGLTGVTQRQLPGNLVIRGRADSVDLGVIEALTPNLRSVRGTFAVDAQVGGSWDDPRLGGWLELRDGAAYVPGLGVGYFPINGRVTLTRDSLVADSLTIGSGLGGAVVNGAVRLEGLTHPILDLRLNAHEFTLIDVDDYLTLRASGQVQLTGPVERPVLTGSALATNSVIYFADLITKDIVNLEDPLNVDLVDTTALRAQRLRSQFQSRFLDSLAIRDLRFRVGENVWLRSSEANVSLEGQVVVNKERRRARRSEYRVSGELTTSRGTYVLKLGPVFRTFTVEEGTVRYFNTPDLNASLDLSGRYLVRTALGGGEDYPVIARITGTLLVPKLTLTSEPGRPPLPERELVALLVTGTTTNTFLAGGAFAGSSVQSMATSLASTVLSSELQRSLISDAGLPVDLVEIRPGFLQGNSLFATGGTVTTLALGRQLSDRLFATINLGSCLRTGDYLNARYLGATLEYRLHRFLKLQIAAEPVQSCLTQAASTLVTPSRYQFGADLRWDREY
jgi:translocation and assembly module TamB